MTHRSLFVLASGLGLGLLLAQPLSALPAAAAAQLKPAASVTDENVRVGDLFEQPGSQAAQVVAGAPEPGRQLVLDAVFLNRIARTYGVSWRASSSQDQIVVSRAAQVIGADQVRAALLAALGQKIRAERIDLTLDNSWLEIKIPTGLPREVVIENLDYAPNLYRFTADLVVPSGGPQPRRVLVTGRAVGMVPAPVLLRRINPGEIIERGDLGWIETAVDRTEGDFVTDPEQVIGLTPRHFIPTNLPLRSHDMEAPRVVAKGSVVLMVLQTTNMTLTAEGRALQAGAKGDQIRVVNTHSNRVVDAVVLSPSQVAVVQPTLLVR